MPLLILVIFFWRKLFFRVFIKTDPENNLVLLGSSPSTDVLMDLLNEYGWAGYNLTGVISDYKENPGCFEINGSKCDTSIDSYIEKHKSPCLDKLCAKD